jgi:nucleoside-diphosphate-sugar epimerase
MNILITGASGYLGNNLALKLADMGHQVHALVRSAASGALLQHPHIKLFTGDIMDEASVMAAMKGCQQVYHGAAKVGVWAKDSAVFYKVNVEGTRHVLNAAKACGVQKTVFTSTCGVIGPTTGEPLDETANRTIGFVIDYDRSKKMAEDLVMTHVQDGMQVVIVSPSKVYGPGNISHGLTANAILHTFLKKRMAIIPRPGTYKVCFAYSEDVVNGHILAMEKGVSGEKYILGGTNISYFDFFNRIRELSSCRGRIIQLPKTVIKTMAHFQELNHRLWGFPVRFTASAVDHLFSHYTFCSNKAIQTLGYRITTLDEALDKTIHFLNQKDHA